MMDYIDYEAEVLKLRPRAYLKRWWSPYGGFSYSVVDRRKWYQRSVQISRVQGTPWVAWMSAYNLTNV